MTAEQVADVLFRAADRVQFKGWTRFTYAVDADLKPVGAKSPAAVAWCAQGALKVEGETYRLYCCAEDALRATLPTGIMQWNDQEGRTAGEVADTMRCCAKELLKQVSA